QRERVEAKGPVDLKSWTQEQIYQEAQRAYLEVWSIREQLGHTPIASLSEYIQPNNYPPGVRDTLRDAVTYLWVELLADTTGWRPEQSNELFRLDLKVLLRGNAGASKKIKLDDPAVHPLLRIAAILDDLEAWHTSARQREAALEASLARLR